MPTDVFYWVLNMSIMGSITGLILLLIRKIKKLPRRIVYALWIVPFVRFVLPFSLSYEYSVAQLIKNVTGRIVTVYPSDSFFSPYLPYTYMNSVGAASDYFPITYKTNALKVFFECASTVWYTLSALILVLVAVSYVSAIRSIKKSVHVRDNIYVSDRVKTPAVYGIIRPKIVFPAGSDVDSERFALLHERVHIRRLDNLWRLVGVTVCAVHYFNPIAWICLRCLLEDMELSADEAVLRELDDAERDEYARSLVEHSEKGRVFSSAFGGAGLRTRIEKILTYKKMTAFSVACLVLFAALLALVLITNTI